VTASATQSGTQCMAISMTASATKSATPSPIEFVTPSANDYIFDGIGHLLYHFITLICDWMFDCICHQICAL